MKKFKFKMPNFNLYTKYNIYGWLFILPGIVLLSVFVLLPIFNSVVISTQSCKGVICETNLLGNIQRLFTDQVFLIALKNTFMFFIIQVPIMIVLGIFIAVLLNNPKLKFRGLFRTAIFLPTVTSLVAYTVLFKMMFGVEGIVNEFLLWVNVIDEPIKWLIDSFWMKVTLIIALTWRWTGYNMVFFLAGLQNIDTEIYEASEIDGANKIQQFFLITVPLLKPIILFTTVLSTIGMMQLFDEPFNLTSGGASTSTSMATLTLSQYIYNLSFKYLPNFGYAATVAYVIVIIVAILTYIQFKVTEEK